tara:strand:+ start:150 stop:989 length:840 start_codon:yes stop_codon:yes gene_type:complete
MLEYLGKLSESLGLPIMSSSHGHQIDTVIGWVHWLMIFLFVGWGIYLIYALFRFNNKSNPEADYNGMKSHFNQYVEIGVIVFEAFLLVGLSLPLWSQLKTNIPDKADVHEIRVVAQQFAWNIHYPGEDGIFGSTSPNLVDEESNPVGLDRNGNGSDDIITINQLHLPVNKQVLIYLSTKDVIHNFSLPEMRVKQDAIPGMEIPIYFTPTMTSKDFLDMLKGTAREGMGYEIACAQLCGNSHYRMKGYVTIETEQEFIEWLAEEAEYIEDEDDEWGDDDW